MTGSADAADTITIDGSVFNANPASNADGHTSKKWRQAVGSLREVGGSAVRRSTTETTAKGQPAEEAAAGGSQDQQVLSLLKDISGTEIPETVGSFSLAITKCGHAGRWKEAVGLLRAMGKAGAPPSRSATTAPRRVRELEEARRAPWSYCGRCPERASLSPTRATGARYQRAETREGLKSYSLVTMACGDAGRLEPASSLLKVYLFVGTECYSIHVLFKMRTRDPTFTS